MLRNRAKRNVEFGRDIAGAPLLIPDEPQNSLAIRLGEDFECGRHEYILVSTKIKSRAAHGIPGTGYHIRICAYSCPCFWCCFPSVLRRNRRTRTRKKVPRVRPRTSKF